MHGSTVRNVLKVFPPLSYRRRNQGLTNSGPRPAHASASEPKSRAVSIHPTHPQRQKSCISIDTDRMTATRSLLTFSCGCLHSAIPFAWERLFLSARSWLVQLHKTLHTKDRLSKCSLPNFSFIHITIYIFEHQLARQIHWLCWWKTQTSFSWLQRACCQQGGGKCRQPWLENHNKRTRKEAKKIMNILLYIILYIYMHIHILY